MPTEAGSCAVKRTGGTRPMEHVSFDLASPPGYLCTTRTPGRDDAATDRQDDRDQSLACKSQLGMVAFKKDLLVFV